jgi:hypothetical protein
LAMNASGYVPATQNGRITGGCGRHSRRGRQQQCRGGGGAGARARQMVRLALLAQPVWVVCRARAAPTAASRTWWPRPSRPAF